MLFAKEDDFVFYLTISGSDEAAVVKLCGVKRRFGDNGDGVVAGEFVLGGGVCKD